MVVLAVIGNLWLSVILMKLRKTYYDKNRTQPKNTEIDLWL